MGLARNPIFLIGSRESQKSRIQKSKVIAVRARLFTVSLEGQTSKP